MKSILQKLKSAVTHAVSPNVKCVCCGVDVFDDLGFCPNCFKNVVLNNGKVCKRCGVALHGEEDFCGHCAFEKTYFDIARSPFCYDGAAKEAILKMKFGGISTNAEALAKYLVFQAKHDNLQFDTVTYVPMTEKAKKVRGYNQAQLLAEHFCDILQIDGPLPLLQKTKETARQEQLNKQQRKENIIGAFSATAQANGKNVLIIDDIKTTGSTLNECAKALKKKGAASVVCLTVASREENLSWETEVEQ